MKCLLSYHCIKITYHVCTGPSLKCGEKYATLPISGQCGPMKLMSLEEAQARSLSPDHPLHKERQRENSLPDTSTATLYHTVIDISDNKYDLGSVWLVFKVWDLSDAVTCDIFSLCWSGESFLGNPRSGSPFSTSESLWTQRENSAGTVVCS